MKQTSDRGGGGGKTKEKRNGSDMVEEKLRGLCDELSVGTKEQALTMIPRFPMENAKACN